jgi:dimethylamine monooxygenase subunit A
VQKPPYFTGPPRFDVGLKPIAITDWLLPDDQAAWLVEKNQLIDRRRDEVFVALPRSMAAQIEAANLISQTCSAPLAQDEPPLLAASRLVSDDLVIMEQIEEAWTSTAVCLCNPTFFSAGHAIGKSLSLLHEPVPDGDFGLSARIGRVFANLQADTIIERHNWTVQWSDARYTPDGTPLREQAAKAATGQEREQLFLRVERQTIRRLPVSGAVLFTIRIRLSKLAELLSQCEHAAAFTSAWQTAPQPVRDYKKWAVLERHVAALLKAI